MEIKKTPEGIWQEYQDGLSFNSSIGLEETVKINNNFYHDKQWEGVNAPDLDKPCFNFIKPAVNYYVAQLVSDDVGASIEIEEGVADEAAGLQTGAMSKSAYLAKIMRDAVSAVLEQTNANYKHRLLLKRMALDGDMVLHSYFDPSIDTGQQVKGAIATEIICNTDIFFGDPTTNEVERQPYIIVRQRRLLAAVREEINNAGGAAADIEDNEVVEGEDYSKRYVTVLTKYYKENGTVHFIRTTDRAVIRREVDLGYKLYPIAYASWESEKNSYHGVSPVTGKINNQILLNKMYALASLDRMNYSFPKVIYDETRLPDGWNNNPGEAVGVDGNPRDLFADMRVSDMSGQIMQLIGDIDERSKSALGIYDAALGNAKPDNTSALLAVQQAAAVPLDLQRQDFYRFVEDCVRIWLDIMSVNYGVRQVSVTQTMEDGSKASIPTDFDFADIAAYRWRLRVDIGASVRWSEVLQMQFLDRLMNAGIVPDAETYLECVPNNYLRFKPTLLERIREKARSEAAQAQQQAQSGGGGAQTATDDYGAVVGALGGNGNVGY